jgi:hypothetical protein
MRKLRQPKRRKGKMIHKGQTAGAKINIVSSAQNNTANEISLLERLISRQADLNNNTNRLLERLANIGDRTLGSHSETDENLKTPGPPGGTIAGLEWQICQAEFICSAIAAQVSRLEVL